MKTLRFLATTLFLISLVLSACTSEPALEPTKTVTLPPTTAPVSTVTSTPTLDPCALENISSEAEKVHKLMREFDDASLLASSTPLNQLNPTIADLQRIRREAEDSQVPACLVTLKQYQLAHMNTVINTMLGFLSGADSESLNQGIALARQQHDQYTLELANLLGITVVAPLAENLTPGAPAALAAPTFAGLYITNPGPTSVNLRAQPDLSADSLGMLEIGASAALLGRTDNTLWLQVEMPGQTGQTAWVYASLIQLSDPTAELPVLTPMP
jgi:hypothetical protein